ncbi:hypothetical protein TIFTF001_001042 [Ficus carica]|uniref:ALOG domain-containing protein n=1 Tax=Ficus carica TaxID=3494 RepID=A0AA87ZG65_FICCA|nr:hypothetical protein TIFTF001_001042 [Ficus carica]
MIPTMNNHSNMITSSASSSVGGSTVAAVAAATPSRYENQKRRDWNTFCQYLRNHRPPLSLPMCSGAHVLEFLRYLDQFGKTKVHNQTCPFFGLPNPPAPCPCPLRQAWGSLDALIGRLRAAYEEHGGRPEANPFGARAVRLYLREVRDFQAKARGVSYEKKRKRPKPKINTNNNNNLVISTSSSTAPPSTSTSTKIIHMVLYIRLKLGTVAVKRSCRCCGGGGGGGGVVVVVQWWGGLFDEMMVVLENCIPKTVELLSV